MCKEHAHEHTGSAEAIRPSLRNGVMAYGALSPVFGLSCPRRQRDAEYHRQLAARVEASGPHDFAVRDRAVRPRAEHVTTLPRPPHPDPNVRDDRETPLVRDRMAGICK